MSKRKTHSSRSCLRNVNRSQMDQRRRQQKQKFARHRTALPGWEYSWEFKVDDAVEGEQAPPCGTAVRDFLGLLESNIALGKDQREVRVLVVSGAEGDGWPRPGTKVRVLLDRDLVHEWFAVKVGKKLLTAGVVVGVARGAVRPTPAPWEPEPESRKWRALRRYEAALKDGTEPDPEATAIHESVQAAAERVRGGAWVAAGGLVIARGLATPEWVSKILMQPLDAVVAPLFGSPPLQRLAAALAPCTEEEARVLRERLREGGRGETIEASDASAAVATLKKSRKRKKPASLPPHREPLILSLCERMKEGLWKKRKALQPATRAKVWDALLRLERRWVGAADGGGVGDEVGCSSSGGGGGGGGGSGRSGGGGGGGRGATNEASNEKLVLGGVDVTPALNLPNPHDSRRVTYARDKKLPQVAWMLERIEGMVSRRDRGSVMGGAAAAAAAAFGPKAGISVIDVGGGRGALAIAVAARFAKVRLPSSSPVAAPSSSSSSLLSSSSSSSSSSISSSTTATRKINTTPVHVLVVDVNEKSLEAGRQRAAAAGLSSYTTFSKLDVRDARAIDALLSSSSRPVAVVFGLHCCGGLAEAALEVALRARAGFVVCSCCFRSNPMLASLSRASDELAFPSSSSFPSFSSSSSSSSSSSTSTSSAASSSPSSPSSPSQHAQDRMAVAGLAVADGYQGQHRAQRAINALRLRALEARGRAKGELRTWQEYFPRHYSIQNRVLCGEWSKGKESKN